MSFVTKEWKDRLVEFSGRRKLKNVSTGEEIIFDVERNEGTVSQTGDAFSATNMNDLEQRIANEFTRVDSNLVELTDSGNIENFSVGEDGSPYITFKVGADSVTKKLGSMTFNSAIFVPGTTAKTAPCNGYVLCFGNYTTATQESSMTVKINGTVPTDLTSVNAVNTLTTGYKYMMAECKQNDSIQMVSVGSTNGMMFFE